MLHLDERERDAPNSVLFRGVLTNSKSFLKKECFLQMFSHNANHLSELTLASVSHSRQKEPFCQHYLKTSELLTDVPILYIYMGFGKLYYYKIVFLYS